MGAMVRGGYRGEACLSPGLNYIPYIGFSASPFQTHLLRFKTQSSQFGNT